MLSWYSGSPDQSDTLSLSAYLELQTPNTNRKALAVNSLSGEPVMAQPTTCLAYKSNTTAKYAQRFPVQI